MEITPYEHFAAYVWRAHAKTLADPATANEATEKVQQLLNDVRACLTRGKAPSEPLRRLLGFRQRRRLETAINAVRAPDKRASHSQTGVTWSNV